MSTSHAETAADPRWSWLYKIGGAAALFSVAIIPIQLIMFIVWGQPETALVFRHEGFGSFDGSTISG